MVLGPSRRGRTTQRARVVGAMNEGGWIDRRMERWAGTERRAMVSSLELLKDLTFMKLFCLCRFAHYLDRYAKVGY